MLNESRGAIPVIPVDTNYWIIRSGIESKYFNEFAVRGCIALGWDRISDIESLRKISDINLLKKMVLANYPELDHKLNSRSLTRKISDISGKIYKFINELKIGDIIVTPGKEEVLIGEIVGEPYLITDNDEKFHDIYGEDLIGDLNKARKVKWIKRVSRNGLEPNLRLILGVYHGIAPINNAQVITEINRAIYNFYVRENMGHSVFKVNSQEDIDLEKYAYFINSLKDVYNLLKGPDSGNKKLSIKTNVQSPGPIEIIGDTNLLLSVVLATKAILKNDSTALEKLSDDEKEKVIKYKEENQTQYDYDDYDFPSYGTY